MGKFSATIISGATHYHDQGSRTLVRTDGNVLYAVISDNTSMDIEVWKSSDEGATWAEQDSGNKPSAPSGDSYIAGSVAIDDGGLLRIAYLHYDVNVSFPNSWTVKLRYIEFDTSDDTFQNDQNVNNGNTINTSTSIRLLSTAIAYSNTTNTCHIAWVDFVNARGANGTRVLYIQGKNSSWSARQTIASNLARHVDIMISNALSAKPVITCYQNSGIWINARLYSFLGSGSSPTGWTADITDSSAQWLTEIAVAQCCDDAAGDQWIAYPDVFLAIIKHNNADAWGTWQTPINVNSGERYKNGTLATRGYKGLINDKRISGQGDVILGGLDLPNMSDYNSFQVDAWTQLNSWSIGAGSTQPRYKWSGDNNFGGTSKLEGIYRTGIGVIKYFSDDLDQPQ